MSILEKMLKQTAVYWAPSVVDRFGNPTWTAPVEISCRWEEDNQEFMDSQGERQMSNAIVYVPALTPSSTLPAVEVEVQGVLLLGALSSSVDQDNPKANVGAWEVRKFAKLPTLKATKWLRTCYL
jgi:hypothetical protein